MSPLLVKALRDAGVESAHVRELGLQSATDEAIFDLAVRDRWVVVTADRDFTKLVVSSADGLPSLIHVRCRQPFAPDMMAERLELLLSVANSELERGVIVTLRDEGQKLRRPAAALRRDGLETDS